MRIFPLTLFLSEISPNLIKFTNNAPVKFFWLYSFRQDLSEQLDDEEESGAEAAEARKKMEAEINDLKQDVEDLETALKKVG